MKDRRMQAGRPVNRHSPGASMLERGGGYVWRGGKAFDLMKQDDETKAEWARYLTLNERAARAYDDLRSRENRRMPQPLPTTTGEGVARRTVPDSSRSEYDLRYNRLADLETVLLTA